MSTPSEFAALLHADPESGFPPTKQSKKLIMPPQSLAPIPRHEQTPLLPPVSPRNNPNKFSDGVRPLPPATERHSRASSDFAWAGGSPLADPSHPLIKNATAPSSGLPPRKGKRPLRAIVATSATSGVLGIPQPPKAEKRGMHRRIKSDVPRVQVLGIITKSDLLKNLPDPRW